MVGYVEQCRVGSMQPDNRRWSGDYRSRHLDVGWARPGGPCLLERCCYPSRIVLPDRVGSLVDGQRGFRGDCLETKLIVDGWASPLGWGINFVSVWALGREARHTRAAAIKVAAKERQARGLEAPEGVAIVVSDRRADVAGGPGRSEADPETRQDKTVLSAYYQEKSR